MSEEIVDARNLLCPMPVIKIQNAVLKAEAGQKISIMCTDPGVKNDIPAWCRINGHNIESIKESGSIITIIVEVCNHS
ncbi:hypothetical protein MNBD_GAMMA12-461 [hydrothermal vent metagenome]|uniref:UPF0033 domain-containing protein n=1 Tax=hydrothermal vent metagenome TaxID=652676 RepID=A0A3B0YIR3_9ZZZZ